MISLRRSQRRGHTTYKVGDVVEIVRNDGVSTGVLLHKTNKNNPDHPRWVVAVGGDQNDEEVCEKSLGKVVESGAPLAENQGRAGQNLKPPAGTKASRDTKTNKVTSTSSDQEEHSMSSDQRKSNGKVTFANGVFASKKRNLSSSAAQSNSVKRVKSTKQHGGRVSTRASARNNPGSQLLMTELPSKARKAKAGNKTKPKKTEDVIEVKMHTGVLYLYRGLHRRAEFVWYR